MDDSSGYQMSLGIAMNRVRSPDGLPHAFMARAASGIGEIYMADAGQTVRWWHNGLINSDERLHFATQMVRQLLHALKTLHSAGYSHSDLKMENICAYVDQSGELVFTLIDFGVCSKLSSFSKIENYK